MGQAGVGLSSICTGPSGTLGEHTSRSLQQVLRHLAPVQVCIWRNSYAIIPTCLWYWEVIGMLGKSVRCSWATMGCQQPCAGCHVKCYRLRYRSLFSRRHLLRGISDESYTVLQTTHCLHVCTAFVFDTVACCCAIRGVCVCAVQARALLGVSDILEHRCTM